MKWRQNRKVSAEHKSNNYVKLTNASSEIKNQKHSKECLARTGLSMADQQYKSIKSSGCHCEQLAHLQIGVDSGSCFPMLSGCSTSECFFVSGVTLMAFCARVTFRTCSSTKVHTKTQKAH